MSSTSSTAAPTKTYPFFFGGSASACAACFTHPLDLLKVRLQTATEKRSIGATVVRLVRDEGPLAFYNGLSASLLRQLTYSTARFGAFEVFKPVVRDRFFGGEAMPLWGKILLSASAGIVGGAVGTPADQVNIRMQANVGGANPDAVYKHALDGLIKIARSDGIASLWLGVGPNLLRAALMTAGQIATYEQVKEIAVTRFHMPVDLNSNYWGAVGTQFACSNVAGLVATAVCSPVDVIKTRVMNAKPGQFSSAFHCFALILKNEGPLAFFKGFVPSWTRLGPHTVLTFLFLEQFKGLYDRMRKAQ